MSYCMSYRSVINVSFPHNELIKHGSMLLESKRCLPNGTSRIYVLTFDLWRLNYFTYPATQFLLQLMLYSTVKQVVNPAVGGIKQDVL